MAFDDETTAFRKFGEVFPRSSTLLIDTYDTVQGVKNALASGAAMQAVRLDSGDLLVLSREVRRILDEAGRSDVKIVASGDLNEYKIHALLSAGAPIDVFGVGTELVTSRDEPTLSTVYKLVEQETAQGAVGRFKLSTAKKSYPYAKQVFRQCAADGVWTEDIIGRDGEQLPGRPLLEPVIQRGALVRLPPSLDESRECCAWQLKQIPVRLLSLDAAEPYPVRISEALEAEAQRLADRPQSPKRELG
jgi:nicotinate phosphoribosyltransferase